MRRGLIKKQILINQVNANRPIIIKNPSQNNQPANTRNVRLNETTHFLERGSDRVFIIGGGPSLKGLNLTFLDGEDVICVNKSLDLVKNPKYFITMDYSFFSKSGFRINAIKARAQSSHFILNRQHRYIQNVNGVYTDTRSNLAYEGLEHFSSVISSHKEINETSGFGQTIGDFCHGSNSGYCAIQFAILAGYKEIYLLGFDLAISNDRRNTHFHNQYPPVSIDRFYHNLNMYKRNLTESITRFKNHSRVNFYTITPSTLSPLVPPARVASLKRNRTGTSVAQETVNAQITKTENLSDLIIVAYYTVNTPYEEEAKKLMASLNRLGLNHDVIGVPNLGNWQANTRFKAKFMEDMLNKHPGKNLLYVDSDAIVHSKPILFENYNCDIAVRWQDFRWRKNECLSGTIFMANNERTRELCRRWQNINVKEGPNAKTFEQWNLGTVIKEMEAEGKITTKNLPPEYTMIFDSMRSMYPNIIPVIEHFQASRKLKNKV